MAKDKVPDAWDDDWEAQTDKSATADRPVSPAEQAPMTRAERLARHEESNRRLWQSAEAPQEFHYLSVGNNVPPAATTTFKPAIKVLNRKPAPKMINKRDPVTGIEQLTIQDDEEEEVEKNQPTLEEIRMRQQRELEEKQRKYEEARAKIFGEPVKSNPPSGRSSPGNVTPPQSSDGRPNQRGRGRGGGRAGFRGGSHNRQGSQGRRQPPSQPSTGTKELYDPNYSPKPGFALQKKAGENGSPRPSRSSTPRDEDQVIRAPRGPDGSGRGGFGFARGDARGG